jgi:hypothetical protein
MEQCIAKLSHSWRSLLDAARQTSLTHMAFSFNNVDRSITQPNMESTSGPRSRVNPGVRVHLQQVSKLYNTKSLALDTSPSDPSVEAGDQHSRVATKPAIHMQILPPQGNLLTCSSSSPTFIEPICGLSLSASTG